jgi:hypothetical protein
VENVLRAHDDDQRVPVFVNRHGRVRTHYATGFQARRLTVFSLLDQRGGRIGSVDQ